MRDSYTEYAELYDLVYEDYDEDIPFYVAEAQRAHGPCLELGCGTGRILIPIAEAGITVNGVDLSAPMIARARRKVAALEPAVRERITLSEGDMRTFQADQRFALIYIPFRAFLHLMQVSDQLQALNNIRQHLLPGGRLALNFFDPSLEYIVAHEREPRSTLSRSGEEFVDPRTGNLLVEWITISYNQLTQHINQYYIYDELDQRGRVVRRLYRNLRMRYIFRWEFEHLLHRTGFEIEALYGSWDRGPVIRTGGELIWIARAM